MNLSAKKIRRKIKKLEMITYYIAFNSTTVLPSPIKAGKRTKTVETGAMAKNKKTNPRGK